MQRLNRAYFNFANSLKSSQTRSKYEWNLNRFLFANKITIDRFVSLPIPDIENMLIDYITKMKSEGLSTSYINVTLAAIKHLCIMNDIVINSRKITKFVGEPTRLQEDRPYTHEEINQLLNVCDLRMKALVLLLASTGMRIGALPTLKVGHLNSGPEQVVHPESSHLPRRVTIYADSKDKYITFCTPECSKAINDYLEFRKKSGERITEDSPLIREQFDINDLGKIRSPHALCRDNYSNIIRHALIKCGLREVNHSYGGRQRHKITAADGFRKFFTNQLIEADIKTEYRWLLEGHDLKGNDRYYVRITEQKLYEQYQKAIPFLTIDPTQKLQKKVDELSHRNDRLERALDKIDRLEKELGIVG